MGYDPTTGKRLRQWVSVKGNKKEAEQKLSELLHQIDTGSFVKPGKTTVGEFLERWLKEYAHPNLSPQGFERYESILRVHLVPALGHIALTQLQPEHLQKHYSARLDDEASARTVRYDHVVLHVALETAVK